MSEEGGGWPVHLSEEVTELLKDLTLPAEIFGAVVAATVAINEHRGDPPGATSSPRWPEHRRIPIGADGALGVAEYVIVADVLHPHVVLTRVQLY